MNQNKKHSGKDLNQSISGILDDRLKVLKKSGVRIFDSVSIPENGTSFATNYKYRTNFSVSIILSVVNKILHNDELTKPSRKILEKIQKDASKILLSEKTSTWTWNYWRKNSIEHSQFPYPDDLDDTSCALFGLLGYFKAKGFPENEGEGLAYFINLLNKQRIGKTGTYKTWILNGKRDNTVWKDDDLAVQSNIANLLSQRGVRIKSLENIFEMRIQGNRFNSKYYPGEAATVYFMSRHYNGRFLIRFGNKILERLRKNTEGLDHNLLVCALVNCVNNLTEKDRNARYLGAWEYWLRRHFQKIATSSSLRNHAQQAFCNDPKRNGVPYRNQSATVTCLIEMEALSGFLELQRQKYERAAETAHLRLIKEKIECFAKNLPRQIRGEISSMCNRILNGENQEEVWLLPFWWSNNTTSKKTIDLSYANTLGWAAYRIYDDCLDGTDPKSTRQLPIANICIYEAFATFLENSKGCNALIKTILQRMELAIAREGLNKEAENLQEKSIAHSIGPVIISVTKKGDVRGSQNILLFFKYYLTARQLADDIRDKLEDEKRGFRNLASDKSLPEIVRRMRTLTRKADLLLAKIEMGSEISGKKISEMVHRPEKELTLMMRTCATEKTFVKFTEKLRRT